MNIGAVIITGIFFIFLALPSWESFIVTLIMCIPVYMIVVLLLPTGGRAPRNSRQGSDHSANSGEPKK